MDVLEQLLPGRSWSAEDAAEVVRERVGGDEATIRSWSPERIQFLTDVLMTASEGWIGYWATGKGSIGYWAPGEDRWPPPEHGGWAPRRVGLVDLARALDNREALAKYVGLVDLVTIDKANRENDAGLLDADDCDALFHLVLLGAVVYA